MPLVGLGQREMELLFDNSFIPSVHASKTIFPLPTIVGGEKTMQLPEPIWVGGFVTIVAVEFTITEGFP